jgi:hypothetical protein
MTLTFENDNDVIVYALEKIISYTRKTQQIFVAQCIWWLASVIDLEQGLVQYIDNLHGQTVPINTTSESTVLNTDMGGQQDKVLKECEEYLRESRRLRDIATLKSKGKTQTGRIHPTPISKQALRKKDRSKKMPAVLAKALLKKNRKSKHGEDHPKTSSIIESEIQRQKTSGECLRCAWPAERKGFHRVKDCIRSIKLTEETVAFPKSNQQHPITQKASSDAISSEESAVDSL